MPRALNVSALRSILDRRLQRAAVRVVKGIVQQEDLGRLEADVVELAAELFEGVGAESAGDQAAQVVAAQVHLHRPVPVQRERAKGESAEVEADRAAPAFGAED